MKSRNEEVHPVLLGTRALGLSYRGVPAFCDVNLAVPAQRITALIGPSGCGKTSFLSCLNRLTDLIPGAQVRGAASLCGDNILDPRMDLIGLRRRVGMIFQKPNPFPLSIRRNIELALVEHGMRDRAERAHTVERVLREVGCGTRCTIVSTGPPRRSPVASSSACASPVRWRCGRRCC
jgi:phosphate transport system ATP-binding protein